MKQRKIVNQVKTYLDLSSTHNAKAEILGEIKGLYDRSDAGEKIAMETIDALLKEYERMLLMDIKAVQG